MLRAEFGNFPTRKVTMDAVQESCVCPHFRREGVKEAGCFQQDVYALIDVTHKYHRSVCCFFLFTAGKRTRCHIVLHDLDSILILETDTGHLVKGYTI